MTDADPYRRERPSPYPARRDRGGACGGTGGAAASGEHRRRAATGEVRAGIGKKLDPEQFNLPLEDVEIAQGVLEAAQERARRALKGATDDTDRTPKRNRGHLPKHLPRIERVIEPQSILCPCGCGEMAKIGEDVSERLDIVPAQLRVLVTRRPRYACRRCFRRRGPGACARTRGARRPADRGADRPDHRLQVRRPPAILTARPRSTSGRGLRSTGRPWATGSGAPASTSSRSSSRCGPT